MKPSLPAALALLLACPSCDKAKKIAENATTAVRDQVSKAAGGQGKSEAADPALEKLVDRTAEGVVFRKDLPFPPRVSVRTSIRREINGRFYQTSEIEKRAEPIKGIRISIYRLDRQPDGFRHTVEQASFSNPTEEDPEGTKRLVDPLEQIAPSTKPRNFRKTGGKWTTDDAEGFRAAALTRQLSPVMDSLLIEDGAAPRPIWFGKKRVQPGEEFSISGDSLAMLLAGHPTGTLKLKLESFEPVHGHPCGVFSVTGDYSRNQFPDFEANFADEDVTIQSGKVWLSLIHPVVLKWDLDTIQTSKHGSKGSPASRLQGAVKLTVTREWRIPADK